MSRQHSNEPGWARFVSRYGVGATADAEVVSVVPFGAFVRLDGVDGFAPKPSWPSLPEVGARVRVRVAAIDDSQRRFAVTPE